MIVAAVHHAWYDSTLVQAIAALGMLFAVGTAAWVKIVKPLVHVTDALPTLMGIAEQFKPNGGMSLRDSIDRLEKDLAVNTAKTDAASARADLAAARSEVAAQQAVTNGEHMTTLADAFREHTDGSAARMVQVRDGAATILDRLDAVEKQVGQHPT